MPLNKNRLRTSSHHSFQTRKFFIFLAWHSPAKQFFIIDFLLSLLVVPEISWHWDWAGVILTVPQSSYCNHEKAHALGNEDKKARSLSCSYCNCSLQRTNRQTNWGVKPHSEGLSFNLATCFQIGRKINTVSGIYYSEREEKNKRRTETLWVSLSALTRLQITLKLKKQRRLFPLIPLSREYV